MSAGIFFDNHENIFKQLDQFAHQSVFLLHMLIVWDHRWTLTTPREKCKHANEFDSISKNTFYRNHETSPKKSRKIINWTEYNNCWKRTGIGECPPCEIFESANNRFEFDDDSGDNHKEPSSAFNLNIHNGILAKKINARRPKYLLDWLGLCTESFSTWYQQRCLPYKQKS